MSLRIGGTLSATGITGGLDITDTSISVANWAGLLGTPGITASPQTVNGRPGMFMAGDQLGKPRFFSLDVEVHPPTCQAVWDSTDAFLSATQVRGTPLEVDLPDSSTRFLIVTNIDPGLSVEHLAYRRFVVPFVSDWPYWREGGNQESDTISGADTLTVGGDKPIYDAVLVFAGDGTFTHSGLGWAIEVTGSTGAVTVDLGARTVTQGGSPANNLIRRTPAAGAGRVWGWFTVGANSVTSDVSVGVTWRNQYP